VADNIGGQLLAGARELEPVLVEGRVQVGEQLAQLLAVGILVQDGELRLCSPQRQLFVTERQPGRELAVL
jgi:hypothetical protein